MSVADGKQYQLPPTGRSGYIPARYVFAAVTTLGTFLIIVMRTSLPVAITAMVRRNTTENAHENSTRDDTCASSTIHDDEPQVSVPRGDFDWDEVTQSYVLTAGGYGMLVSTMIGSRLAEMWSAKHVYTICCFVSTIMFLLVPVTARWDVIALIVFQAVGGLFLGPVFPVSSSISSAWFPPQERQQLGAFTLSASSLGSIASNALTGNLVDNMGWQFVFYLFSALVIAWMVMWMFLVFDSPDKHPRISEEERVYLNDSIKKDEAQAAARLPWKEILLSPPVWAHIAMSLPVGWLSMTLINAMPTYMTNILHYSTSQAGYFCAIPPAASWVSSVCFGFLSQWIRRKEYLSHIVTYHIFNGIATLGTAVVVLCLSLVHCYDAATVALLSLAMVTSSAYIGGSQMNHMDLAVNYAGTLSGLVSTVSSVVGILAPTITGVLTNNQQTLTAWNNVFYLAAAVNVVPFFIFVFFGSVDEQPWNRKKKEGDKSNTSRSEASTVDIAHEQFNKP